jgi:phosphatidylinositol alpha-1,6-mannosyltransferase
MLKIIYLTRNFPPLQGGMERLNYHIYQELRTQYKVFLVGPKGAEGFVDDSSDIQTCPPLPVWHFLISSFWQTCRLVPQRCPVFIFAGSGVAALPAVLAGKLFGVPVLTYLHGLDIIAPNLLYQKFFLPAIRLSQGWLVNSQNTRRLAINAGMPAEKIEILNPGTDLPNLSDFDGGKGFRGRIKAGTRPILLSVGRLTKRKGLVEFINNALPRIVLNKPDVLLVVIGSEPIQSIAGYSEAISKTLVTSIEQLGLNENITFLGNVDDRTLSEAFLASQLHIFPVLDLPGDVEGFGMVAVEAAAHGLPTVAFASGGVPDSVKSGVSGWLIEPGDYPTMAEAIVRYLIAPDTSTITLGSCRQFAGQFSWKCLGKKLNDYCRQFLDRIQPTA